MTIHSELSRCMVKIENYCLSAAMGVTASREPITPE